jgi:hypothetical protein
MGQISTQRVNNMNKAQQCIKVCEDTDHLNKNLDAVRDLRAKRNELTKKRGAIKVTAKPKGEPNPDQDRYDALNKQIDDIEAKIDQLSK